MWLQRTIRRMRCIGVISILLGASTLSAEEFPFADQVAPVLKRHCIACHNDQDQEGGLSLQSAVALMRGGDSGPVIFSGDPDGSLLIQHVTPHDGVALMPQGMPPLSKEERETLRHWVASGARWPDGLRIESEIWWSLRPIQPSRLPNLPAVRADWCRTPIDAWIAAGHATQNLPPASAADRRTLIRRVYFDLTGLPPTVEQADAFVGDPDPLAYERLVDRLLASPHFGERWARHWLDVVHYGESHGYDKDKPRPHAWPYRDYVIRAWNQDKPYARFVQEQIAGDVLFPHTRDGIEALGFLAAGPWDFIGHAEVPETKIDGKVARHLDRDDMVQNTIQTFTSMTAGCAQCHDHKFDPIPQRDYYQLQAVFAALDRADREYDLDPQLTRRRHELLARQRELAHERSELQQQIDEQGGEELRKLDAALNAKASHPPQFGYHSAIEPSRDVPKWVQVDLQTERVVERIEIVGCHDDFNGIGAGFGFPVRFRVDISNAADFSRDVTTLVDRTLADVLNPGIELQSFPVAPAQGRFVRITAQRLAARQNDYIFALAELRVFDREGTNVALQQPVTGLDSIDTPPRWAKQNLVDGITPTSATDQKRQLDEIRQQRESLFASRIAQELRDRWQAVNGEQQEVQRKIAQLPEPLRVYAGTIHFGSGAFVGTGAQGGKPRVIHVLARGDILHPLAEVGPGALTCVPDVTVPFPAAEAAEGNRRSALAQWLTDRQNPLVWRSIANRIWLYHFGRGLVETANDFGRMGQTPSHPELLDWLAAFLRDGGSLKELHRLIVTSATYRQSSSTAIAADPDNQYFARMPRRRLEAEAVRDWLLVAAGRLDPRMGGPSFQDFVIEKPEHSPHYEYDLFDPEAERGHRRSIYRFIVRSRTQPLMTVLDCADPSMLVDKRNETISPLQALALLNNRLSLVMARSLADRAAVAHADQAERIGFAFAQALGRRPTLEEVTALTAYADAHGLANACRAILNLNEFVFID